MATVALTKIKYSNDEVGLKEYEPGDKVNKSDFSKEEWAGLVEAGAVGPEAPAPLTVEVEEEEESAPAAAPKASTEVSKK